MTTYQRSDGDTAGFVPIFWAQRALDVLRQRIVLPNLFARDSDFATPGWRGKAVTVPYPGEFSAVDKVEGTPVTPQVPVNGNSVTITLNKHKVVPFSIENFVQAQANTDLMDKLLDPAVTALAEQFQTDLFVAALKGGTTAPLGTPTTDLTAAVERQAMTALDDAKAPTTDRHIVMSPKDKAALLGDSTLATYFAFSQPDAIRNGYFGELYGMDQFWTAQVPTGYRIAVDATGGTFTITVDGQTTSAIAYNATAATIQADIEALSNVVPGQVSVSGRAATASAIGYFSVTFSGITGALTTTASSLTGSTHTATVTGSARKSLAFHKNAIMFITRPFEAIPASYGVFTAQANDMESGLSIRVAAQYDINNIAVRCNLDMLYGMDVLRPTQLVVIDT